MEYATVFDLVSTEFKKERLDYLLIGGFAINSYGVTRQTMDVDFMITASDYPKALAVLKAHGYEEAYRQDVFSRLKSSRPEWMDVDFLFVDRQTLEPMVRDGKKVEISGHEFTVPSLDHLIALKLHSLRYNPKIREYKDLLDILKLIQRNQMDVRAEAFRNLCLKFGTEEIYRKILEKTE